MKKLRMILQYKYLIFLLIVLIYAFIITSNEIYKTNYEKGEISLFGYVISFSKEENKTTLIIKAKEKIQVTYYGDIDLNLGDYIFVRGILEQPNNNTIFNLFNYRKYLMSNKIYYILKADEISKVKNNQNIFYEVKNLIYKRINKLNSKDYVKTFILGDKSDLDSNIEKIYQENGVSHLLAISGMHISLIVAILYKILKKFKYSHLIISIFLIFYSFLTNFTPSVIRTCSLFIFGKYVDTKKLIIILFGVMLIYNPYYIYNVGFLFSFIISFYLIIFKYKIKGNYFSKMFKTSLICFLVSIPILINNFYQINILSVIINLIFIPFVSFIIFPFSILVLIFPFLDNIFCFLINILEFISIFINKFNINLIFAKINVIIFFIYYLLITFVIIKPKSFYLLIIVLLIHNNIRLFENNINVTTLDVGQGDSILLEIKDTSVLIDTGGSFYNNNISNNKIIPYLKSIGIKKINYLILTHGDYDHMGEAITIVENFRVEKVIFNCGEFNELEQELIKVLDKKKISYYSCIKELNIDNNKLYFLNNKDYGNENDNSSVIYTELNNHKFLFMGDAGVEVEEDLIKKYNLQDIDVLKVGHHGSKTSSSKSFIDEVNPKYSIISVGKNNRYSHPNDNVLDNLENSKIYRTDQDGSIMLKINNNKLKIENCFS